MLNKFLGKKNLITTDQLNHILEKITPKEIVVEKKKSPNPWAVAGIAIGTVAVGTAIGYGVYKYFFEDKDGFDDFDEYDDYDYDEDFDFEDDELQAYLEEKKAQTKAFAENAEEEAEEIIDEAKDKIGEAKDKAADKIAKGVDKVKEAADKVKDKVGK